MYAIVEIAGQQFKVKRGDKVISHRLQAKEGDLVEFDKVLLIDEDGKVSVGTPTVNGAKVAATVVSHFRGEKLIIFKKKRRKGYQKQTGHRQDLTELLIQGVLPNGGKVTDLLEVKKKEAVKKADATSETSEVKAKPAKKTAAKKTATKKAAAKKTTNKKSE
ncbi:MAG: 50S ribosomal protein L21 [Bacteroidia bacterium]|nr:50S ribosomal protein L21 [Bacteroidia bacterium]